MAVGRGNDIDTRHDDIRFDKSIECRTLRREQGHAAYGCSIAPAFNGIALKVNEFRTGVKGAHRYGTRQTARQTDVMGILSAQKTRIKSITDFEVCTQIGRHLCFAILAFNDHAQVG